ncbi:MAG: signal recognition particle protein [Clostridiales bacterium]|nr:signal recognition particle protein [Clostridiales bacterium]
MAAFEGLSSKLGGIIKKLRSKGRVTESDIKEITREIKLALLEADVNYKVVKEFINNIQVLALGDEVIKSLTPGQQIIKIVNEQLIELLGGNNEELTIAPKAPTVYMLCGLQGTGKTTTCAKVASLMRKKEKKVLLCALDVYRPAAIDQLVTLGKQLAIDVYHEKDNKDVVKIAKNALSYAKKNLIDIVILDTAGRLHIDKDLMGELSEVKKATSPTEILLIVDAMTGQDAVTVANSFNELLEITGVILSKMDGDTRGGAALSVKKITNKPIKFITTGEKLNDIEVFYPERMASRILGMGDVMTLIEKAQENVDIEKAQEMEKKIRNSSFTLDDFMDQIDQINNMGPLENLLEMMPGVNQKALKGVSIDDKQMGRTKAIIQSMTLKERTYPKVLDASRRKRIAKGSGTSVQAVNKLLKDFSNMKLMMKKLTGGKGKKGKSYNKMKLPF